MSEQQQQHDNEAPAIELSQEEQGDQKAAQGDDNSNQDGQSQEGDTPPASNAALPILNGKFEILPHKPLPEYDHGTVKAYAARSIGGEGSFFALVCDRNLIPRFKATNQYKSLISDYTLTLGDLGVVHWPPAGQECFVYLYQDPMGLKKIHNEDTLPILGWKQDRVISSVIEPMVHTLQYFKDKDIAHGSIRPSNLFLVNENKDTESVIPGDCLTQPSSLCQPAVFLPIHRSMADPIGRGPGTHEDDLYALGVTIVGLMRTTDALKGLSEEDIIRKKIDLGSYSTITGQGRFKGSILELLRGLLNDHAEARWNLDEVFSWIEGNRVNQKQVPKKMKAARPFSFNQERYFYPSFLAMDLEKNIVETEKSVETRNLQEWMIRAMEAEDHAAHVDNMVVGAQKNGRSGDYPYRLAAFVAFALDPMAPIKYKGIKFRADALGIILANAIANGEDLKPFCDLIEKGTISNWVSFYQDQTLDRATWGGRFEECRKHLQNGNPGYGIERCLYTLAPGAHCLSPVLKDFMIKNTEYMIKAFESLASKGGEPELFFDRHSIAFVYARDQRFIESAMYDLGHVDRHRRILGNLRVCATVQKKAPLDALPYLGDMFYRMMPDIYEHIHDRELVKKIDKDLKRFADEGNLHRMADIITSASLFSSDLKKFKLAMGQYKKVSDDLSALRDRLAVKEKFGLSRAGGIASFVSIILAGVVIMAATYLFMSGRTLF